MHITLDINEATSLLYLAMRSKFKNQNVSVEITSNPVQPQHPTLSDDEIYQLYIGRWHKNFLPENKIERIRYLRDTFHKYQANDRLSIAAAKHIVEADYDDVARWLCKGNKLVDFPTSSEKF